MATKARLDVVRYQMTEPPFHVLRHARDVTTPPVKNNIYQWGQTGTFTLQPLNVTTDFHDSADWEALKFRLADCVYNPDWWTEVPVNTNTARGGPSDYFLNLIVKKENFPSDPHKGFPLIEKLIDIGGNALVFAINYESTHGVSVLRSSGSLPANQGYCLRFRIDGRSNTARAGILDFGFGEYLLRLNTYGEAQLWQSPDFVNYGYVYSWRWAHTDQIHGRSHRILIQPHARNKIEFVASTGGWKLADIGRWHIISILQGTPGSGLYEVPGDLVLDADGKTPIITHAAPWSLAVSREFRPMIQVSRIGFANGSTFPAQLWDSPISVTGRIGLPFAPLAPISSNVEADANGCSARWSVINADTSAPWESDGESKRMQFTFAMQGAGDIPGPGLGSSRTPELYNYSIDKHAFFFATPRQTILTPVHSVSFDSGDAPEAERMSVSIYDKVAYQLYKQRGDIPLEVGDDETGLLYFEGNATQVEATACPAQTPNGLHIEASGLADNMVRTCWSDAAPDFGIDTHDTNHRGWLAADVIRQCFESAGENPNDVVIEEEARYLAGFRLWNAPSGGGTRGGGSGLGAGHDTSNPIIGRWHPRPGAPINEFTDFFIRSILGWNWYRDRHDRRWHVYKRPDPRNPLDAPKMAPKVEFVSGGYRPRANVPAYTHRDLKFRTKRPRCSTILLATLLWRSEIPDREALNGVLRTIRDGTGNPEDPIIKTELKSMFVPFTNILGYANQLNRHPDVTHPDFLGQNRTVLIPAIECNTIDAVEWVGRRLFEDNCFGDVFGFFEADWGDQYTYRLRKWDVVLINGERWYFHAAEPQWQDGTPRRAHYTVTKWRPDAKPPR